MIRDRLALPVLALLLLALPAQAQPSLLDPTHDALACAFYVTRTVPPARQPRLVQGYIPSLYLAVGHEAEAQEVARLLGDNSLQASVLAGRSTMAYEAGDSTQAAHLMTAAAGAARRSRTPEQACAAWCAIGQSYMNQGRPDDALRYLESVCSEGDQEPCGVMPLFAEDLSGEFVRLGRIKEAREIVTCLPPGWGSYYVELAVQLAGSGYLDEARDVLASAPQLPGQDDRGRVLSAAVSNLADRGQWAAALALVESLGVTTVRGADAIAVMAAEADTAGRDAMADSLYRVALDRLLAAKPGPLEGTLREERFESIAVAFAARRDFDHALIAARALPLRNDLDQNDRAARAQALGRIGVELRRIGEAERSTAVLDEARDLAQGFPDDSLRCTLILAQISREFFDAGFPDLARQYLSFAIGWNRRLSPRQQGYALADLAACPGDIRDDKECSRLLVEALQAAAAITDVETQSRVLADLGSVQLGSHLQIGHEGRRALQDIVWHRGPIWRANLSE